MIDINPFVPDPVAFLLSRGAIPLNQAARDYADSLNGLGNDTGPGRKPMCRQCGGISGSHAANCSVRNGATA
jgi:hypothetical protein